MGLFDFVKDIGKKLFPPTAKPEDAAAKIRAEIEGAAEPRHHRPAGELRRTASARSPASARRAEAMQKAVLIAGNVQGVAEVEHRRA